MSARTGVTRQAMHDFWIDTEPNPDWYWDDYLFEHGYYRTNHPWYPLTSEFSDEGLEVIRQTAQAGWDISASQAAARAGLSASEALTYTPTEDLIEQWNLLGAFLHVRETDLDSDW